MADGIESRAPQGAVFDPEKVTIVLVGGGHRDGTLGQVYRRDLARRIALPEVDRPTLNVDQQALCYRQVSWEWDGTISDEGHHRFRPVGEP